MEPQSAQLPSLNLNSSNIFKHYLKEPPKVKSKSNKKQKSDSAMELSEKSSSLKASSQESAFQEDLYEQSQAPSEIIFQINEEQKQQHLEKIENAHKNIQKLIQNNKSITVVEIARRLNLTVKFVLHYLGNRKFQNLERAYQDIIRQNPRQLPSVIGRRLKTRYGLQQSAPEATSFIRKRLRYYYTCGKCPRNQNIYEKKDNVQILSMRLKFCQFLRKYKYQTKNIYFCGVRVYSYEMKANFIWVPESYRGVMEIDYAGLKYKPNEVVVLVTISNQGIIRQDMLGTRVTEQILAEHLRQGYLKIVQENNQEKFMLVLSNTIPDELFPKWYVELQMKKNDKQQNSKNVNNISQDEYLQSRAKLMKQFCHKIGLKKYMNEPPYAHRMSPFQGIFQKLDSTIDSNELKKLFFKNAMTTQMLQSQLWESLNEVNSKQCLHFYHPLEIYLTHSKIDQSMFLDKQWEDIFFDTFDSEA